MRCHFLVLLVQTLLTKYSFEQGPRQQTSVDASITTSIQDAQESLQIGIENIFATLNDDDTDLNTQVGVLSSGVAQFIAQMMVMFIEDDNGSTLERSSQIVGNVSSALSEAAEAVGGVFASLDVDGISTSLENSVQKVLSEAAADNGVGTLVEAVVESVTDVIGTYLANILEGNFSADTSLSSTTTSSASTQNETPPVDPNDLAALIAINDIEGLFEAMRFELSRGGTVTVADALVSALPDSSPTINASLTLAFLDDNFPVWQLGSALGVAYNQDPDNFSEVLSQAVSAANTYDTAPGLAGAISFALAARGDALAAFNASLSDSITNSGCDSVSNVLVQAQEEAKSQGVGSAFFRAVEDNPEIEECLKQGQQRSMLISILAQLDEHEMAAEEIVDNLNEGYSNVLIDLISLAVEENQTEDLGTTLAILLGNSSLTVDYLSNIFTAALIFGSEVQATLTESIKVASDTENIDLLVSMIQFAFSDATKNIADTFKILIQGAIEDFSCGSVKDTVSIALDTANEKQKEQILQYVLMNPELNPCVPQTEGVTYRYTNQGRRVLIGSCFDITPPGNFTCKEQAAIGKCARSWMLAGSFCAATCGYCEDECLEIQPTAQKTCAIEEKQGRCNKSVEQGFCKQTCSACPDTIEEVATISVPQPSIVEQLSGEVCNDVPPSNQYTCAQQKEFGKCDKSWMIVAGFCKQTCGRCGNSELLTKSKGYNNGECGCCAEQNVERLGQIIATTITQALQELNFIS